MPTCVILNLFRNLKNSIIYWIPAGVYPVFHYGAGMTILGYFVSQRNMLIFLFGADTYRSKQKLKEIIVRYKTLHQSGLNLWHYDFSEKNDFALPDLKEKIESVSMFQEKKLIILERFFEMANNEIQKQVFAHFSQKNILKDDNIIILIWEEEIDKKNSLIPRHLKKPAISEEFKPLEGQNLEKWILKEIEQRGGKIEKAALVKLAAYVGSDLWQLSGEIDKLILFKDGKEITEAEIDLLVKAKIDPNIFKMIDALGARNKKTALELLLSFFKKGENEIYLLTMFVYQFRNLVQIKDLIERGQYFNIGKIMKLHPFVIKKTLAQASSFGLQELKNIYSRLKDLEIKIKTGRISAKEGLLDFVYRLG